MDDVRDEIENAACHVAQVREMVADHLIIVTNLGRAGRRTAIAEDTLNSLIRSLTILEAHERCLRDGFAFSGTD